MHKILSGSKTKDQHCFNEAV